MIGPKVYLARGPSGHPETFRRQAADQALIDFLGNVTLKIAIEGFLRQKARERTQEQWSDVIGFLGALLHMPPDLVPLDVAVAFWAQVQLVKEAIARAKPKGN